MKAFEEWDKNNKINYATISNNRELNVKSERRRSWKRALEWLLANSSCEDACDFKDNIERELQDGKV